MKQITVIDQLHRRRLTTLEAALKNARVDQTDCERRLADGRLAAQEANDRRLQLKRDVDAALLNRTVRQSDLQKSQHRLLMARDAVVSAKEAVERAVTDVAAAEQRTQEAVQAWQAQAVKVEKFGTLAHTSREAHKADALYREEWEQEELFRRRA